MCIYIISDDHFFVRGLENILATSKKELKQYSYANGLLLFCYCSFRQEDIVIVDIHYSQMAQPQNGLAHNTSYFGVNIVFVVDLPLQNEPSNFYPYWIVSKKCPIKSVLPLLKTIAEDNPMHTDHLSRKENIVLRELAVGHSTDFISRKLNLSTKTISSHKQNAFRKLGMTRLNDMSLICYRQILNLYAGFNRLSAQRAGGSALLPEKKAKHYSLIR
ncbi:helix-turn-helix domain-containing protein [Erwinia psidii]|uniref:Helix-turn-helix transcriptional regulator n=1 Tax=Erwinia psidii TaxID=69224 RepID=A0A3N6RZ42_9GAMM|nr:LuxR C-terminal-related transcriptional regulator [Erwinia psidii]MCX8957838.1 helix-turn-helix transcriptional regulator [Erwinia psidii]MCX8960888.1 helix-turn-helix transcriptional regulator [Erwinia psidii]MCX8964872.1 helix-turn-helix transcriptional regulator [Erwinia psidii]RQM38454.1 helix-turn-helix transcriptional regulator [Erwinia psidii]